MVSRVKYAHRSLDVLQRSGGLDDDVCSHGTHQILELLVRVRVRVLKERMR